MPVKIYDCSNSTERPVHRNGGGPKENDIIHYLKSFADRYDCSFVKSLSDADVILTNDVFDKDSLQSGLPKVKRMDGIFCIRNLMERNDSLNEAACQADHVMFITEYSQKCFKALYNYPLKKSSVVRHWVCSEDFNNEGCYDKFPTFTFCASATDWRRPEKRIEDLILFAECIPEINIQLIGKCEIPLPENITHVGYLKSWNDMTSIMHKCHAFLNLTYRDAATKTVCQAINCGLPVLYSDTGGVGEMVGIYGYGIYENNQVKIYEEIPHILSYSLVVGFQQFMVRYPRYLKNISTCSPYSKFDTMLEQYFSIIKSTVEC